MPKKIVQEQMTRSRNWVALSLGGQDNSTNGGGGLGLVHQVR